MQILYVDMDGVLVDFDAGEVEVSQEMIEKHGDVDEIPGFYDGLPPVDGAIDAFHKLSEQYETYILSTAPWGNPSAWTDKLLWVKKHLPEAGYKRLILSHHKNLNRGDYLIDDRKKNGAGDFDGEHIHFGEEYPNWDSVLDHLL